jgi:hypothetical protein
MYISPCKTYLGLSLPPCRPLEGIGAASGSPPCVISGPSRDERGAAAAHRASICSFFSHPYKGFSTVVIIRFSTQVQTQKNNRNLPFSLYKLTFSTPDSTAYCHLLLFISITINPLIILHTAPDCSCGFIS